MFDTVGSLGLPEELTLGSRKVRTLFGFPDSELGVHIERAYQALALNETRADFVRSIFSLSVILNLDFLRTVTNSDRQKRASGRSKSSSR